jgi:hypothetical protein
MMRSSLGSAYQPAAAVVIFGSFVSAARMDARTMRYEEICREPIRRDSRDAQPPSFGLGTAPYATAFTPRSVRPPADHVFASLLV